MTALPVSATPAPFTPTRADRWRIRALAVLVGLNILQYVLLLAGIPEFYRRIVTHSVGTLIVGGDVVVSQALIDSYIAVRGLTPSAFAIGWLVFQLSIAAGFWAAGILVLSQARGYWFRWLAALFLIFYPSGQLWLIAQVSQVNYGILVLNGLLWPIFLLFFYLFPDGRAVPRWGRWVMGVMVAIHLFVQVVVVAAEAPWIGLVPPAGVLDLFNVIILGLGFVLLSQGYRYLRVAGPVERKQMQWFVLALAVLVLSNLIYSVVTGDADLTGADGYIYDFSAFTELVIPLAITIAILRYRLWDIDVIIRRTLVYGVLSGLLALVYFGSVVVLEGLLRGVTGSGSQVAIVLSTLLIAALFGPLRGRVQAIIDQRFYRRKYDAARTLAVFGASVRDNVDLDALGDRLTAVVDETMQPTHVRIWAPPEVRRPKEK